MKTMNITCVICPKGCNIAVNMENGKIAGISGNSCTRGEEYAAAECTNPVRTLTTTVRVAGGELCMAPVKSQKPVPKHLLMQCVSEINKHIVNAPINIGDVIVPNILGTGADIIATGNMHAKKYLP